MGSVCLPESERLGQGVVDSFLIAVQGDGHAGNRVDIQALRLNRLRGILRELHAAEALCLLMAEDLYVLDLAVLECTRCAEEILHLPCPHFHDDRIGEKVADNRLRTT